MRAVDLKTVTIRPYAAVPGNIEAVPALVTEFMNGNFHEKLHDVVVEIETDSEDTGQGMSYKNRVFVKQGGSVLYDTGMLTWRDGRGGYPTVDSDHFRKAGLLRSDGVLYLGIENAEGEIVIRSLPRQDICVRFDALKAQKSAENQKLCLDTLKGLRAHFRNLYNRGNQYPWFISDRDIKCDLGSGFMAYHNHDAGRGGEVWDKFVVLIVHEGRPYISDEIHVSLSGNNWSLSHVTNRKIEGNKFTVGVACCHYKSRPSSPEYQVTFELCIA